MRKICQPPGLSAESISLQLCKMQPNLSLSFHIVYNTQAPQKKISRGEIESKSCLSMHSS